MSSLLNRLGRRARPLCFLILLSVGSLASAQLLGEVLTVAAITAELNPAIRLPSGSYRVMGTVPPALIAKVPNASSYTNWEAYTAKGIAANLFPAHLHQISTSFALAGLFQQSRSERRVGSEVHTQYVFSDGMGQTALLYAIRTPQELVWLIAKAR